MRARLLESAGCSRLGVRGTNRKVLQVRTVAVKSDKTLVAARGKHAFPICGDCNGTWRRGGSKRAETRREIRGAGGSSRGEPSIE